MKESKPFFTVDKITKLAMLTAVSIILFAVEFSILPAAPFLRLNFSDAPALIAAFMFGPIEGIIVTVFKVLLGILLGITKNLGVGDLANAIIGILYVLPAGIIYARKKTLKRAVVCLVISSAVMIVGACFANLFILYPVLLNMELSVYYTQELSQGLNYVLTAALPFNAIKAVGTSLLTFLAYKPLHKLFNRIDIELPERNSYLSKSPRQTERIGTAFSKRLLGGDVVVLHGELGAGKTQFTKGIAKGLGITDQVTSPTFALHNLYYGKETTLNHFDFYRLNQEEKDDLGFEEIIGAANSVTVIEWADNLPDLLPAHYFKITITALTDNQRRIIIEEV